MASPTRQNKLAGETSPYLLQHATNPVAWYPWGEEALALAKAESKPILLSIGYSACHWCHVMAHESFEDQATAEIMNAHFVNIKVDREERPDIDKIYQLAQLLLTQRGGGWPLTMFLTPEDHAPFFGGTYFPPEPRHGLPGFKDLLNSIAAFYAREKAAIRAQNQSLKQALAGLNQTQPHTSALESAPLLSARSDIAAGFDSTHGGFSGAPKFPNPGIIERLLRHYAASASRGDSDGDAATMALFTLAAMAKGGIYDQLGGGFYRYAVDHQWMIPHFEKMLYDNAQLVSLYCDAWLISRNGFYATIAKETADWMLRAMQSPEGGFYSSLDADSEGGEGEFYVWNRRQVAQTLGETEHALFARRFGLDRPANFERQWHLRVCADTAELQQQFDMSPEQINRSLADSRIKLLQLRNERVRPGRDEKILTAWNALAIKAMAAAGRVFEVDEYTAAACGALDFIRATLWRDGRLLATCKDGKAHLNAYLDDYAFLVDAILQLLQTRWHTHYLHFAVELADVLLNQFEDGTDGGFFFTSHDHEQLLQRSKPLQDEAIPAGNGVAASALLRLGSLLGNTAYLDAARRCLEAAYIQLSKHPTAHCSLLLALEESLLPPEIVVLRGDAMLIEVWRARAQKNYAPRRLVFAIPQEERNLPGIVAAQSAGIEPQAYICQGMQCLPPIGLLSEFETKLKDSEVAPECG